MWYHPGYHELGNKDHVWKCSSTAAAPWGISKINVVSNEERSWREVEVNMWKQWGMREEQARSKKIVTVLKTQYTHTTFLWCMIAES